MANHPHRPSFGNFFVNWRESEDPFLTKCKLVVKNEFRKVARLRDCCDHPGEPGC